MELFYILIAITILFFVMLIIKQFLPDKLSAKTCAICFSVSMTWIILLLFYYLKYFDNQLIIALLMGMTLLGIYYIFESKVKKELTLFRLPFLLSLILAGYFLLTFSSIVKEIFFLALVWLFFFIVYIYRNNNQLKKAVNKIVECCKRW